MAKTTYYRQCSLQRVTATGREITTTWIPETYAQESKVLKLRREDEEWDDGWKVTGVFGRLPEKMLPDFHKARKSHRKSTGDSQPKCSSK